MRTLFIDFDGTICHGRFWSTLPKEQFDRIQLKFFTPNNGTYINDWMKGYYTAEDVCLKVAKDTGYRYEVIFNGLVESTESFTVDQKVLDLLDKLGNYYHLVLITGNMDTFNRFTLPQLKLERYFNEIVNSFTEGSLKTDNQGAQFTKYSLTKDVSNDILIEDSLKSCETFHALGGTALQVTHETNAFDHLNQLYISHETNI